jgi:hypothetical protein
MRRAKKRLKARCSGKGTKIPRKPRSWLKTTRWYNAVIRAIQETSFSMGLFVMGNKLACKGADAMRPPYGHLRHLLSEGDEADAGG